MSTPSSRSYVIQEKQQRDATSKLHVIIVGAGLGGLGAAISTLLAGHDVTVLEAASNIGEVGAGIQVLPNAARILFSWGLEEKLEKYATKPQKCNFIGWKGNFLSEMDYHKYAAAAGDFPFWDFHRSDLHRCLLERAVELGVKLETKAKVDTFTISPDNTTATVYLVGGRSLTCDLLVGADGINSKLREEFLCKPDPPQLTGDLAYRLLLNTADMLKDPELRHFVENPQVNYWVGPDKHAVNYVLKGGQLFNMVLLVPDDMPVNGGNTLQGNIDEMRGHFAGWDPRIGKMLQMCDEVLKWRLCIRPGLEPTWSHPSGAFTMLGDAVHATLPYLASGAGMALEDGGVLGLCLARLTDTSAASKRQALRVYEDCRRERTERVVRRGTYNQWMYHLHDGQEQVERDAKFKKFEEMDAKWLSEESAVLPASQETGNDPFPWRYHGPSGPVQRNQHARGTHDGTRKLNDRSLKQRLVNVFGMKREAVEENQNDDFAHVEALHEAIHSAHLLIFAGCLPRAQDKLPNFKMRSAVLFAAISGLAAANPVAPRDTTAQNGIDLSVFDSEPIPTKVGPAVGASVETPTYNPAVAKAEASKDAAANPIAASNTTLAARAVPSGCGAQQPDGYGPVSSPDTYDNFIADPQYPSIANAAPVPQGYSLSYSALQGSQEGNGYLGLYTLKSFDTIKCQQYCDAAPSCYGINVYLERDPAYDPTDACPNPSSITNYKCTLWGLAVTPEGATNVGQWRNQFHVGISGSNGYSKLAPPPSYDGFTGPVAFGGATQAPNSYMGSKYYPGPYDPIQCAAACKANTKYDHDHPRADGTYDACNFFNSYVLSKNNVPQGTYCSLYTTSWDKSYSTNVGQWRGSDYYSVSSSYGYTLTVQDPGHI
ncbi:FAD binding domain-containing protein [Colletotrichum orchidophilum]|uniref:FAD binding domain-containing protein n=1 Tax=Colletotrichum orchidophilum TaxID=1209926 RepID=A0A1G4BK09_9PEZI|nr:FAD binding domain-containing protein [Colletotrichum orchidophilum]OHF01820.1 FAD binding domain-containing protein [Colletotrichum orchidophilum]